MDSQVNNTKIITLREYINNHYFSYHTSINRSNTIRSESYRLNAILEHEISDKIISDITVTDIEMFLNDIMSSRKVHLSTLNRYKSRLSAIFHHAEDNEYVSKNIVKRVKSYKEFNRNIALEENEIANLLLATRKSKNKALYLIVVIALNTGMRKSEILNLKRSNIKENSIKLMEMTTKSGYARDIPLNETLVAMISDYLKTIPPYQEELFLVKDIKKAFNRARKLANMPDVRIHDLRRTFATQLKNKGVSIYDIKEILGHSSIAMTEKYLKQNFSSMQTAVNKVSFC